MRGIPRAVGLISIALYIALVGLGYYLDQLGEFTYNPPYLLLVLNVIFTTGIGIVIAVLSAGSYLKQGHVNVLLLGSAVLAGGLASLIGGYLANFVSGNFGVTAHNIGMLLSSILLLFSAVVTFIAANWGESAPRREVLITAYALVVLFSVVTAALTYFNQIPIFLGPTGPTFLRQSVVALIMVFFVLSALLFYRQYLASRSIVLFWYALGIGMFAIGMVSLLFQVKNGDISSWIGRLAQYTGSVFFLVAVLSLRTEAQREPDISLRWAETFRNDRQQFATLFATMLNGFMYGRTVMDKDGKPVDAVLLDVNEAFERITGVRRDTIIGRKLTEVLPGLRDDLYEWLANFEPMAKSGQPVHFEGHISPLNKWLSISAYSPQKGYFVAIFEDISERKMAEKALLRSQHMLRLVLENVPVPVFWKDLESKYLGANRLAARDAGLSDPGEIIGKTDHDLAWRGSANAYRADDSEVIRSGIPKMNYDEQQVQADGSIRWLRTNKVPLREPGGSIIGVLATYEDITDAKRALGQLEEEHTRLQLIMDNTPVAIGITDTKGGVVLENGVLSKIWRGNISFDEVLEYSQCKAWWPETGEAVKPEEWPAARALKGEASMATFDIERFDGTRGALIVSATPIRDADGNVTGTVWTNQDVSELTKLEKELKRSNFELRQFAYITSHDLREPLRMISSYLGLLERKYKGRTLDTKAEEYLHFATDGAIRMQQMINDLLTYSRIETKGKDLEYIDMNVVMRAVLRNLDVAMKESGAYIAYDELPTVLADGLQMTQLLQNLIDNAIKYRRDETPRIEVSAVKKDGVWLFSIKDNGAGIPQIMGERVFELFQRGFTQDEVPGTGIGLAIAKKIVERHGGRIWFESEEGRGTTFFFTIPVKV